MAEKLGAGVPDIIMAMERLARHGLDAVLAVSGIVVLLVGILIPPQEIISEYERLVIAIFGGGFVLAAVLVWRQKSVLNARAQEMKFEYQKLVLKAELERLKTLSQQEGFKPLEFVPIK